MVNLEYANFASLPKEESCIEKQEEWFRTQLACDTFYSEGPDIKAIQRLHLQKTF